MDRITDRPDMTSAVDRGRKALTQLNSLIESRSTKQQTKELRSQLTKMDSFYHCIKVYIVTSTSKSFYLID